jgi:GNAT superfamily N-acetyltransferase
LEKVQEMARRTISTNYRSFLGDEGVDWFIQNGESDRYISENLGDCLVLTTQDRIVGFCVCLADLVDLLMIDQDHHRQGLGSLLLGHCERVLFQDHEEITLETFEGNAKAMAFYRKNGWLEKERKVDETSGSSKVVLIKRSV